MRREAVGCSKRRAQRSKGIKRDAPIQLALDSAGRCRDKASTRISPLSWNCTMNLPRDERAPSTRQEELRSTLFLAVVMAPVLAVIVVAGYGFLVWMFQLVAGPPGH
jgi:nitrate reductase NapE